MKHKIDHGGVLSKMAHIENSGALKDRILVTITADIDWRGHEGEKTSSNYLQDTWWAVEFFEGTALDRNYFVIMKPPVSKETKRKESIS